MSKNNIMNTYARFDVTFEKGVGSRLYDINRKEYIDFVSGVAVNCLGHSHPAMIDALNDQSKTLIHVSNLYWEKNQLALGKKLAEFSDHDQVFFCNSGTEAVETSLKLARKYGKIKSINKHEIIYMKNSFHGRTFGALAVTGQEKYQKDFTPLMEGGNSISFNDIDGLAKNVNENTCAIIVEPIQGEGGVIKAEKTFLQVARNLCDKFDALLIFDEVQCGIGRVGTLFAYQSFGVIPDVICMAKGLGGGFPIGATLANKKAASAFVPGDHGCTFGGNPLACAVSLAVLEQLVDNGIINEVNQKSKYFVDKLKKLQNKYNIIESIQGMGLMLGIKVSVEPKKVVAKCFEKGLLLVGAGKDVIRILPPLNVLKEDIDKCVEILDETLSELSIGKQL